MQEYARAIVSSEYQQRKLAKGSSQRHESEIIGAIVWSTNLTICFSAGQLRYFLHILLRAFLAPFRKADALSDVFINVVKKSEGNRK